MNKEDLRIIFMGTPEFAVESLKSLIDNRFNVVAVVTQPDKPVGRHGSVLKPSPVKEYALSKGLPVLQPEKMKDATFIRQLASYKADIQVVVAFRMLPETVWAMPRYGTFNVHAALLPQYRGAAPINWAIINGEKKTGVTTFFLDHNIDTGRIIMQKQFDIPDDADLEYVYNGLMYLGADICIETLNEIIEKDGNITSIPQEECHDLHTAPKIFKETCQINWSQTAKSVYNFVRGLCPHPGAWCEVVAEHQPNITLKIFKSRKVDPASTTLPKLQKAGCICTQNGHMYIAASDNWLEIEELQASGKKRMKAKDFLNGNRNIETYHVADAHS